MRMPKAKEAWAWLKCLKVEYITTTDDDGIEDTWGDAIIHLECQCGNRFQIAMEEWPGKLMLRACAKCAPKLRMLDGKRRSRAGAGRPRHLELKREKCGYTLYLIHADMMEARKRLGEWQTLSDWVIEAVKEKLSRGSSAAQVPGLQPSREEFEDG